MRKNNSLLVIKTAITRTNQVIIKDSSYMGCIHENGPPYFLQAFLSFSKPSGDQINAWGGIPTKQIE